MKKIILTFSFLMFAIVFMSTKCESGVDKFQENPTFIVTKATYQEMIPGVQGQPIYFKLNLTLSEIPNELIIDSVMFKGFVKSVNPQMITDEGVLNMYFYQKELSKNDNKEMFDQTLLYYHQLDKSYFTIVKDIQDKPSMPMP